MVPVDPTNAREFLEAIIGAFSVLGGSMAYFSGDYTTKALALDRPPEIVAQRVNEGIGRGFEVAWPASIIALIIMVWS
jgi:hypothetical protein